jgi:hypothetical protein
MGRVIRQWGSLPHEPWEARVVLMLEPRDAWVGLYWDKAYFYVAVLPFLPLRIARRTSRTRRADGRD